jgi:OOP family OmpA-OmpF porin
MKNKIMALTLGLMMILCSVGFAAPVTDLDKGKVAIDLSVTKPQVDVEGEGQAISSDKKTNWDAGLTVGLGNKWGIQYKQQQSNTNNILYSGEYQVKADSKVQEFNVLYEFNKNLIGFVGMHKLSGSGFLDNEKYGELESANKWQVGLTGVTKLGGKLSGWATVAGGSNNFSYELGIAQALSNNWDLNLFYRHKKFTDMKVKDYNYKGDVTISGFGLGVTAKF